MTLDELRKRIEGLFAAAREADPHERSAMIWGLYQGALHHAVFVAFANGWEKGAISNQVVDPGPLDRMLKDQLRSISAQKWPAGGTLIWRAVPEINEGALYMRCVVVPRGWAPLTESQLRALDEQ